MRTRCVLILVSFQLFTAFITFAQSPKLEDYFAGHLTLNDNSILSGKINYNYGAQTISIKIDSATQIYGPNQVREFTMVRDDVIHLFKSLNLGDGLKVYHVVGENDKVAYLEYVYGQNLRTSGTPSYTDPVTGLPNASGPGGSGRSKNLETTKESRLVARSYIIALTSTGKQYIFRAPDPADLRMNNREYLTNNKQIINFLKTIDPTIQSYMKENGLKFRRNSYQILQKTLSP